ncbi:hypothetical protein [Sphingomonas sp.]|uniref:hypothetical protein n=1 Tax=Sphingomonas sp. TaxID=28214 RepID=UPI00307F7C01
MPVIGGLAAKLATFGLSDRVARFAAWAVAIVVLALVTWGAWSLWLSNHDDAVIRKDRDAATIEVQGKTIEGERAAGAAKDGRDRAFAQEQQQLKEKADDAAANGTSPLDTLFDELR